MSDRSSHCEEEEFKLPLRPWLKNHIDKNTFEGLEWIKEKEQIFKIPWTKKGHPDWEKDYKVFKCWAKHRGRLDSDSLDYNKLKGNFRSVLHKSEDFAELKEESVTDQQTGNYKVFKILTSSAVKENRKRSRTKSHESSNSDLVSKQKKNSRKKRETVSLSQAEHGTSISPVPDTNNLSEITTTKSETFLHELQVPTFACSFHPENLPSVNILSSKPHPGEESYFGTLVEQQALTPLSFEDVKLLDLDKEPLDAGFLQPASVKQSSPSEFVKTHEPTAKLLQFFETSSYTQKDLTKFLVTVSYGGEIVVCQQFLELGQGCRILYGDSSAQLNALCANGRDVEDFKLSTFELPEYQKSNRRIADSLALADLGVVFIATERGELSVKRLCQSHVTVLNRVQPIRLERGKTVAVFSYTKYVQDAIAGSSQPADWKVKLAVGEKPPTPLVNLVTISLQPMLAPFIENFLASEGATSSLCHSNEPSSLDNMVRLFAVQQLQK